MRLGSIRQLSAWLWTIGKGYRVQAILNAVIGLLVVAADLSFVWATKLAVDIATHVNRNVGLDTAFLLLVGIIVLQISLGIASRWVRATLGVEAEQDAENFVCALVELRVEAVEEVPYRQSSQSY